MVASTAAKRSTQAKRRLPRPAFSLLRPWLDRRRHDSDRRGHERNDAAGTDDAADDATTPDVPLPCDPGFAWDPRPAYAGAVLSVSHTADAGYTNVGLRLAGPGAPAATFVSVTGTGPWTWIWSVADHAAGGEFCF